MKTITRIAALAALMLMTTATVSAKENLLDSEKASFELEGAKPGSVKGWVNSAEGYYGYSTEKAYEGNASMKFYIDDTTVKDDFKNSIIMKSSDKIALVKGEKYKISFWIYIDKKESKKLSAISVVQGTPWKELYKIQTSKIAKDKWVQVETDEFVYDGDAASTPIVFKLFANGGSKAINVSCYIDCVEVVAAK
ncbi:MAG: carbohydrate binding domain-containing protein [Bacteroidales bacterium]